MQDDNSKDRDLMQSTRSLIQMILKLTPEQQAAVEEFVHALLRDQKPGPTFSEALDGFKRNHPELLRLLAK